MALEKEVDLSSTVSDACTTIRSTKRRYQAEESVSSIIGLLVQESKRLSHGSSNSSANTDFKGVVLQPNGRWGAQIYAKHNRVWLGTFDSAIKAAMAYDSAAIKLRNGENSQRNFEWTKTTVQEQHFQSLYSEEAVLNMIKDKSYPARFVEFLMARQAADRMPSLARFDKQLFQKELTPSDVGTLNRLVIPKNYATKYFPAPDVQLSFYDENMMTWNFKYCYWKSSQSFVFTKGWNRFVKAFKLKANDTVRFYECHTGDGDHESSYMIKFDRAEGFGVEDANKQVNGHIKTIKLFGVVIQVREDYASSTKKVRED